MKNQRPPSPFRLSPGVYRMIREALEGAERIQHRTVWWHGNATTDGRDDDALVFITFDGATARRARAALESAGVLCEEVLGTVARDGSGRIVDRTDRS